LQNKIKNKSDFYLASGKETSVDNIPKVISGEVVNILKRPGERLRYLASIKRIEK
jgi:hypothetical protein